MSLLLGVLMTRQNEPMSEQLKVIESADFAGLAVVKALLAKHDEKEPLFKQVADLLDKSGHKVAPPTDKKQAVLTKIQSIVDSLQKRVTSLEHDEKEGEERHAKVMKAFDLEEKKVPKEKKHRIQLLKKREDRKYKKWLAMSHRDLDSMKSAVAAVKSGDMKALQKTQEALRDSLKAMESNNGGFLHLLQLGHMVARRDCPYCAAQCVDKCHQAGKSYATCLTDCADAGKFL